MRAWHEFVAALGDRVPGGVLGLAMLLLVLTLVAALLWYFFPEWATGLARAAVGLVRAVAGFSPRRLRRRRRAAGPEPDEPDPVAPEVPDAEVPKVPATTLALSADDLAAQGRYREAVRERLRAVVRDLAERGVIEHHPGWTVTELAYVAGWARPAAAPPLEAASEIFSRIWYGQRAATAADDTAMREHAAQVRAALDGRHRVPA